MDQSYAAADREGLKKGTNERGAAQIQMWIYDNCARMSDGRTRMGRKKDSHVPLIHHEYREREREEGREGGKERERERDEGSVPVIRPAGMPVQLGYFKVAYAIRVRLSRGAQRMKSNGFAFIRTHTCFRCQRWKVSIRRSPRSARRLRQWVSVVR